MTTKTMWNVQDETANLEAGFTLIELLIVMSIILIIMMFAVPQVLKLRKGANESSAIQTIHVINAAEASYNNGANGYACPLVDSGRRPEGWRAYAAVGAAAGSSACRYRA